ncbi:hypothetical protein [Phenylobacterium sp.]|uniref:MotE family protein n=1 Tax=Phenylobacterium sp. TaxID=1871053 RepID=UPI00286AEBA8|nr:hypothetical protein [Phenylobacterium sp.]
MPRILPLVGIAVGGVLAINALAGARDLPGLVSAARARAEEAAARVKPAKAAKATKVAGKPAETPLATPLPGVTPSATGSATDVAAVGLPPPTLQPRAVCAPTAAELAKQAGLSPAELQQLQSLGARRTQLDQRETDLSTQLALLAAAEAKLDAKVKVLGGLKTDVQGLLAQADGREAGEVARLVKVFEGMKPKDAAARLAILDDAVRLPIAAKMKEKSLSAVVGQMTPLEAKKLTESLARRFSAAQTLAQNATAQASAPAAATTPAADASGKATPGRRASGKRARPAARKAAPAGEQAAAASAATADKAPAGPAPAKAG